MPDWTLVLAAWGALLSTVLAIFRVADYVRDQAVVRVHLIAGRKIMPETTPWGRRTVLTINVVNAGRRPITITGVSIMLPRSRGELLCVDPMAAPYPVELTEGKPYKVLVDQERLVNDYRLTPDRFVARVDDATGKSHWSHGVLARLWKLHRLR